MTHSRLWLTFLGIGLSGLLMLPSCSTDRSGLGQFDAGTGGARNDSGSGGTGGGGAASGGAGATGTGGRSGSGGVSATGGSGSGGTGTGGAASGGRGTGGAATGGNNASGGRGSGGAIGSGGAGTGGTAGRGSGGTESGGSGTGGRLGTGGAGTGGRLGTGGIGTGGRGTGGRGTGGSMAPAPECATASDCKLVSDCCTCAAIPVGEAAPQCALVCIQSKCAQQQLPQGAVACVAGRCVAGFNCDDSRVSCDIATPNCPDDQVPAINAAGTCYAGGCVPASQCKTVSGCNVCGDAAPACVTYQTQMGNQHHCVTIPAACGDDATCGCLGPTSCVSPYLSCTNYSGNRGVSCGCPNC